MSAARLPPAATSGVAAVAHERAAAYAERHEERSRELVSALGLWTTLGDEIAVRRLLAEPHDDARRHPGGAQRSAALARR